MGTAIRPLHEHERHQKGDLRAMRSEETSPAAGSQSRTAECRVIHPDEMEVEVSSGGMTREAGVSEALVGAGGIHMALAKIPPGCASSPHYHVNCESAIYVLRGTGRFVVGPRLDRPLPIGPGDFIYVPPDAVHQPVNDSLSEPLELLVARNAPVEIVVEWERGAHDAN